jgi:hypothetical protein
VRALAVVLAGLCAATAAAASSALDVTVLPRPGFPGPATDVTASSLRLELVSSRYRDPAELPPAPPAAPAWAPKTFKGHPLQQAIRQQPSHLFLVYGQDGTAGRYLVAANTRARALRYAFDFVNFGWPPGKGWFEEVTWPREADGVLYVENTHLTYANATRDRNAYVSAINLKSNRLLWRSPALVANARTFVLAGDLIVAGYGFTAEPDFLYLLDRRTGRVRDRLALPSAPEVIKRHGSVLRVRTYDHQIVARIVEP